MEILQLYENQQEHEIANLQSDSVVSVYHGTDHKTAAKFAWQGIDARMQVSRLYPHYIGIGGKKQMVNRGLFVTADLNTAISFGRVVIKFFAKGEDLHFQFPSPELVRRERSFSQKRYPNSFRPEVSYNLLEPSNEPQALFRGLIPTHDIIQVFSTDYDEEGNYHQPMRNEYVAKFSREEYKDWYKNVYLPKDKSANTPPHFSVEPDERVSFNELIIRVLEYYKSRGSFSLSAEEIIRILHDNLTGLQTYQQQIGVLQDLTKTGYTTAKFVLPDALKTLGIKPAPNVVDTEQYWG